MPRESPQTPMQCQGEPTMCCCCCGVGPGKLVATHLWTNVLNILTVCKYDCLNDFGNRAPIIMPIPCFTVPKYSEGPVILIKSLFFSHCRLQRHVSPIMGSQVELDASGISCQLKHICFENSGFNSRNCKYCLLYTSPSPRDS